MSQKQNLVGQSGTPFVGVLKPFDLHRVNTVNDNSYGNYQR